VTPGFDETRRRYVETGYGDITRLEAYDPPEYRLRVGDWRVRFYRTRRPRWTLDVLRVHNADEAVHHRPNLQVGDSRTGRAARTTSVMRSAIRDTLDELEQQRLTESNGEHGPARPLEERMLAVGPETDQPRERACQS